MFQTPTLSSCVQTIDYQGRHSALRGDSLPQGIVSLGQDVRGDILHRGTSCPPTPVLIKKKKQLLKNLFCHLHCCYTTQGLNIHYCCFSWNSQLMFIGSTSTSPLTTPTKCPPHKFNYCDLFFAMPSALTKFAKVKFTQNIIALRYLHNINCR